MDDCLEQEKYLAGKDGCMTTVFIANKAKVIKANINQGINSLDDTNA